MPYHDIFRPLGIVNKKDLIFAIKNPKTFTPNDNPYIHRCKECDGFGKVEWTHNDGVSLDYGFFECPSCEGDVIIQTSNPEIELIVQGFDKEIKLYFSKQNLEDLKKVVEKMNHKNMDTIRLYHKRDGIIRFSFNDKLNDIYIFNNI